MKKRFVLLLALIVTTSCTFETSSSTSITLAHSGTIVFKDDKTGIKSITPKGFLMFNNDGDELKVECDTNGNIIYRLNDDNKTNTLQGEEAKLLGEAIKFCIANGDLKTPPYTLTDKPDK